MTVHEEFLELCEIPELLPDWLEAYQKLGLTDEDIKHVTEEWIPNNWHIEFLGVRKLIGAFVREIIDMTKANKYKKQGVKIVYGIMPALLTNYLAIKESGREGVYVSFPDHLIVIVMQGIFHKCDNFFEVAEEDGMTYGGRHCALNKARVSAIKTGLIPSPDIMWCWGYNCDEGPKTDEYINRKFAPDWNVEITRLPHDTHFGEQDDENLDRVKYLAAQMKQSFKKVEDVMGIKISPTHINNAVKAWGKVAFKSSQLMGLMASANPQPFGGYEGCCFQLPLFQPFNTGLKYVEEALDIALKEVREKVKAGQGVLPKGAPRMASYLVPYAQPWISRMLEDNGVGLLFGMVPSVTKRQMRPPSFEDPYMASAEQWLRMGLGMNMGSEVREMRGLIESYKPDALLMGFFDFDKWLGAHHKMAAKLIEEQTGVPSFYIEADFWDDRDYSPEALRTRIESICQVVKMRKEMA